MKAIQNETPKRLSRRKQINRLVALIFNGKTNMTENAKTLGIGRATAYRYWNTWVDSDEAQQIDVEWWAMFNDMKTQSPVKAFEGVTRLKHRKTVQRAEIKSESTEKIMHVTVDVTENEEDVLNKAARILARKTRHSNLH